MHIFLIYAHLCFSIQCDSFLVESILLLCNLFYTSSALHLASFFTGCCTLALVPHLYWNTLQHFHFTCDIQSDGWIKHFLLLILGWVSRQDRQKNYYCTLAHVLYIKSPFNLIVLKENVLNLWIRLLTFSVSKCHTSVDKKAVASNLFQHFSEARLYFIPSLCFKLRIFFLYNIWDNSCPFC